MRKILVLLSSLVLPALSPLSSGAQVSVPESPAELHASDVADAIDASLRWLRGQQREDGSYGTVRATGWALSAFGTSPRGYREGDGPFLDRAVAWLVAQQRANGAFADPDEIGLEERRTTNEVVLGLLDVGSRRSDAARKKALAFLGVPEMTRASTTVEFPVSPEDLPRIREAAYAKLAELVPDGTLGEGAGDVEETAVRLTELSRLQGLLAKGEKAGAARREATPLPGGASVDHDEVLAAQRRGAAFLLAQREDGLWGFGGTPDPGLTAMVTGALLAVPRPRGPEVDAAVSHALDWLLSLQKPDGSIHAGQLANYVTSASVLALSAAGREGDRGAIERAREFLRRLQADEGEGYSEDNRFYGGVGYGDDERPDLSNVQMALEALAASGTPAGDATFRKALVFLQRCQNRSESNDLSLERDGATYTSGEDGGGTYAPGDSKAGFVTLADGRKVARSYGSMTYALLKSYLLAGLPRDDPRVEAVWSWLRSNWTLDVNPGFEASSDPTASYQGLFYYFATMAKALDLYGEEVVQDADGGEHAWRAELAGRLLAMQRQDGSWINANAPRWYEGNPVLATSYALLALGEAAPRE